MLRVLCVPTYVTLRPATYVADENRVQRYDFFFIPHNYIC